MKTSLEQIAQEVVLHLFVCPLCQWSWQLLDECMAEDNYSTQGEGMDNETVVIVDLRALRAHSDT